jgi:uncharacterized membrane protein
MVGLTPLGIVHTAISLVAVGSGAIALIRDHAISWNNFMGKIYVIATLLTCVSGFGIYQHGGFGRPHVLGIITLLVLALALIAGTGKEPFGKLSPYIRTIGFTLTFFFHLVPGITETATRLPADAPLAPTADARGVQLAIGVCFILFLIAATLQGRKLRANLGRRISKARI